MHEFAAVMRPSGRLWNEYAWAMALAEFRTRLRAAKAGRLKPVDHVKEITSAPQEFLYEIRWQFHVLHETPAVDGLDPEVEERVAHVRLYHSEPGAEEGWFVGLHVHEKEIVDGDDDETADRQNRQIDAAVDRYWAGEEIRWGIAQ